MKTDFFLIPLTLLSAPLWAHDKPEVAVTCQLDTTGDSKTYSLQVKVDPAKNYFDITILSWIPNVEPSQSEVVIKASNHPSIGPWSDVLLSGEDEGSKTLLLTGGEFFYTRADQKRMRESFKVILIQWVHPDDGTRAAGVVQLGVEHLESSLRPLLPEGVTLSGYGNCWRSSGLEAYL